MGCEPFHIGLLLWGSACCGIPVKNQRFLPAPFGKGALRPVAADNAHGGFLQFGTSLTCPVSLPSKMGNENIGTMHALPAAARRPARYRYRAKWGTKISVLCTH